MLMSLHYTKLQLLDDLGHTVNDLGLAQVSLCTFWRLHGGCQGESIARKREELESAWSDITVEHLIGRQIGASENRDEEQ